MSNNLRVIYKNLADAATVTVSSTAGASTTVANLKLESRSKVWRSGATSHVIFLVTLASTTINGLILPFTNLTSTATIRIMGYSSTMPTIGGTVGTPTLVGGSAAVFDTTATLCAPWEQSDAFVLSTVPSGVSRYSYGGGTCARIWLNPADAAIAVTGLSIEIVDSSNTESYLEASRMIIGKHWSPRFNTSYGLSATFKDLGETDRLESGDLVTRRGILFKVLNFDLKYMEYSDRDTLMNLIKGPGITLPIFISLFPNDDDEGKEGLYQIYGKLSQLDAITHSVLEMYSTQISIEEV